MNDIIINIVIGVVAVFCALTVALIWWPDHGTHKRSRKSNREDTPAPNDTER